MGSLLLPWASSSIHCPPPTVAAADYTVIASCGKVTGGVASARGICIRLDVDGSLPVAYVDGCGASLMLIRSSPPYLHFLVYIEHCKEKSLDRHLC